MSLLRVRTLLTALLAAAVLAGLGSAAPTRPDLVLGIEWRAGGGQLAWRSATTLKPQRPAVNVGGASVSLRALSPDGTRAALTRSDGQLRVIRLQPLRSEWTLATSGRHLAALAWPTEDRLVAVAGGDRAAVIVIDGRTRRVALRRTLDGDLYGAAATTRRLVALLAPTRSLGTAKLAIVAADGSVGTVATPGIAAGFDQAPDPAGSGRMATPGLAISPDGGRAAVVDEDTFLLVDLETLELQRAPSRALAHAAKRVEGRSTTAVWVRGDRVAVVARATGYDGDRPVSTTTGVRLHLLGAAASRELDATATGAARVGTILLAYGGTALRGYTLEGRLRFELLAAEETGYVQTAGRYAYVGSANSTRFAVVDVAAGRVVGIARTSKPTVLLDR